MTRIAILSAVAFCAFSASAGENVSFSTVDTNADGMISETEFVAWKTAKGDVSAADALVKFIEIDTDASGMISEAEMQAAQDAKEKDASGSPMN